MVGQGHRGLIPVGVLLVLADAERRGAGLRGGQDGGIGVDESGSLMGDGLEERGVSPGVGPGHRVGGGVQAPGDLLEGVEARRVLDLRMRLHDESRNAGRVRGGHRRPLGGQVRPAVVDRPGGPDLAPRGDDVGFGLQGLVEPPAGEGGDEPGGGAVEFRDVLGVGQRGVGRERAADGVAVLLGDGDHRDGDLLPVVAEQEGGEDGRPIVVEDDGVGAAGLGVEDLLPLGADPAPDQHGLAGVRAGRRGGAQQGGVGLLVRAVGGRVPGGEKRMRSRVVADDLGAAALGRRVEVLLVGVGGDGHVEVLLHRVVDAADGQDVLGRGGGAHGPTARIAAIALGAGHDDALGGQALGGDGGRVVLEDHVLGVDRQVHDVHAVVAGLLHGGGQDLGAGQARAAEDPVGAQLGVGGDAGDLLSAGRSLGRGDARDVGAVTFAVIGVGVRDGLVARGLLRDIGVAVGIADEVVARDDLGGGERRGAVAIGGLGARGAGAAELDVVVVDAGVDDADLDSAAGVAELGLDDVGAGHAQCVSHLGRADALGLVRIGAVVARGIVRAGDGDDGLDRDDLVEPGQGVDLGVADRQGNPVPQRLVLRGDLGIDAGVLDRLGEVGMLGLDGGLRPAGRGTRGGQLDEPAVLDRLGLGAVGHGQVGGDLRGRIAGGGLGLRL